MAAVTYEEVLKWAGQLGVYQMMIFVYFAGLCFVSAEAIYMNFIGYKMDHWCKVPELANFTFDMQKHISIPFTPDSSFGKLTYESCQMFDLDYGSYTLEELVNWERPLGAKIISCNEWVFDQSDYSENIVNEWQLVCDKSWQVDFVSTISLTGFLFGAIIGGMLSDRYGRTVALGIGAVFKLAGDAVSTIAPNYIVFVIARFFVGFAVHYCYLVGFVITVENIGAKHRPWMGIAYSIAYSLGFAFVSAVALACQNWRDAQIVMTAPVLIFTITAWFVPESPRWLLSQGKLKEADAGIRQIAAVNNRTLPDDFKIKDVKIEGSDVDKHMATFVDIFRTSKIRRYTVILFVIWFSTNLNYYALSLGAGSLAGDVYLNSSLMGLVEIPTGILAFIFMGFAITGRKYTLGASSIMGGLACLACVPIIITNKDSIAVTVLSVIGKGGAAATFNGLFVFTSEIYPTEVRNVGLGACSMVARISGIAAPYVGGFLGDIWSPMPFLIFGAVGTISGLLILLLPETFGKKLPETVEELEQGLLEPPKQEDYSVKSDKGDHTISEWVSAQIDPSHDLKDIALKPAKQGIDRKDLYSYKNYSFVERL